MLYSRLKAIEIYRLYLGLYGPYFNDTLSYSYPSVLAVTPTVQHLPNGKSSHSLLFDLLSR